MNRSVRVLLHIGSFAWLRGWHRFHPVRWIGRIDPQVDEDRLWYIPGSHLTVHVGRGRYAHPAAQTRRLAS
jgi:hypothetical protein